jgi:hypothetical protein
MHAPPGAVRSLCRPSAPSSLDQRLSNLEEKRAKPLTFHPNMHTLRVLCDCCARVVVFDSA